MEANWCEDDQHWLIGDAPHNRIRCIGAISASAGDE
jgi:hypothetical protein